MLGQFYAHDVVFSGQVGYKLINITTLRGDFTRTGNTDYSNNPVWQGTIDYGMNDFLSIGVAYSIHNTDVVFSSGEYTGEIAARATRVDMGMRLLFHYGNRQNLDLYSGLRVGYKTDDIYPYTSSASSVGIFQFEQDRYTWGIALLGMRYWAFNHVALTLDINLGRPYLANVGIATRLY